MKSGHGINRISTIMFLVAIVTSILILITYHIFLYLINLDLKSNETEIIDHQTEISWQIIDNIVTTSMMKSKDNLNNNIIPAIVSEINKNYNNDNALEDDIKSLSDLTYNDPLTHIFANNIRGKYFNDIQSDSNDMFILMKDIGIISDPSISSSSYEYRSIENEINSQYNHELAKQAFDSLLEPAYDKGIIFWQPKAPGIKEKNKLSIMNFDQLKKKFKESNGDIESLKGYEFLVPGYIFMDKDILGNQLVDDRGNRQDIYQFIVVQGFSVYEIVKNSDIFSNIFDSDHIKDIKNNVAFLNKVQQLFAFLGLIVTVFLLQIVLNNKYKNK